MEAAFSLESCHLIFFIFYTENFIPCPENFCHDILSRSRFPLKQKQKVPDPQLCMFLCIFDTLSGGAGRKAWRDCSMSTIRNGFQQTKMFKRLTVTVLGPVPPFRQQRCTVVTEGGGGGVVFSNR